MVVGRSSKVHKMNYTHPNSIQSVAMGSMRKKKDMGKTNFDIVGSTGCDLSTSNLISSNSNILGFAHLIEYLKIVLESL